MGGKGGWLAQGGCLFPRDLRQGDHITPLPSNKIGKGDVGMLGEKETDKCLRKK